MLPRRPPILIAILLLVLPAGGVSAADAPDTSSVPAFWRTRAERTGYRQTSDYDETLRYCRQIEGASQWARVITFGKSGQGRDLFAVVLSKDRAFTPEQARALGKPILLIQNGIHSGEIEGKDASLALMRDLAVLRTRDALLDHAILIVVPILSVDSHERRSRYNRINQNGPEEMGWRASPIGLNLNRDYLKLETPELRGLIGQVFTRWWPHLLVDNHTTDGADYRHDVTYGFNFGPDTPAPVAKWLIEAFEGRVVPRLGAMGHLPAPYLTFTRPGDPASSIQFDDSRPRFSTGYAPLQCRPGILVETHMLKPYAARVRATYDLMVALLEEVNAHPDALTGAVAAAEAQVVSRGRQGNPSLRDVVLTSKLTETSVPFPFKGVATRWEFSELAGGRVPRYGSAPWDTIIPLYREMTPALTIRQPIGYLVPQEWTRCRQALDLHGVRYRVFAKTWRDTVEMARVTASSVSATDVEGHRPLAVSAVRLERLPRSFRPGDLWVPLDQRSGLVAVHLFEPQAPDGLTYWNAFDTVLDAKEYAEDYVMEPIARKMLAADTALAREFRGRVASDTAFAHDPQARLDFFYRRSPWADPDQNLIPVARALRRPPESVLAP